MIKEKKMDKVVGKLTEDEKKEILALFEKKIALENLVNIIQPSNEKMYEKLTLDYGSVMRLFQEWWSNTSRKYCWEGQSWYINFENNEVLMPTTR